MRKVVGVIPARFASTRFPGKPLALIQGKPMIQWVLEGATKSRLLATILVATDDDRIAQVVRQSGGKVVMTSSDLATGTDRINAAIKGIEADIVVNIQGDEPLIQPEMLDELVQPLIDDPALEMSTLGNDLELSELDNPNVVKVVRNRRGDALYFSRFPIPYSRSQPKNELVCMKHLGLYGYQRSFLQTFCNLPPAPVEQAESLEQLRALDWGARICVVKTRHRCQGVDTPEDLARIEQALGELK